MGLTPDQKTKLVAIRTELMSEMRRRLEGDAGAELPRAERRAQMEAVLIDAEQKLQSVLDTRQRAGYEKLDPELKLGRRPRGP